MTAVHIRRVPDEVVDALKRRAARNERSLQGELRHILSAEALKEAPNAPRAPIKLHLSVAEGDDSWPRGEIYGPDGR